MSIDAAFAFVSTALAKERKHQVYRRGASLNHGSDEDQPTQIARSSLSDAIIEYDDFLPDPNPSLEAIDVLSACMGTMLQRQEAGLEVCWRFSSDRCRAALGGSLERFAQYATNPVFGYLVNCADYQVISVGPTIKGTPTRGDMQTILMEAKQCNDKVEEFPRRFLWTFQKERRPPRQNCWMIHEVIYVKNAYALTL